MSNLINDLQSLVPDYAKDIKLNIESVFNGSGGIDSEIDAPYIAFASAIATGNIKLIKIIEKYLTNDVDKQAAKTAAIIMAQNNIWYSFVEMMSDPEISNLPAGLRMNAIVTSGGTEKTKFEGYSLAASIIGKCKPCTKSHFKQLKDFGYQTSQLNTIIKIASVINALSKILILED